MCLAVHLVSIGINIEPCGLGILDITNVVVVEGYCEWWGAFDVIEIDAGSKDERR